MIKLFLIAMHFCVLGVYAQMPMYYSSVDFTQNSQSIKTQLHNLLTSTHVELPYTSNTSTDVWDVLKVSDIEVASTVALLYGWNDLDAIVSNDRTRDVNLSCHVSSCSGMWVREHVYPRSLGQPNLGFAGPGSDCHNLRAIDSDMNNTRGNRKFSQSSGTASTIGSDEFYPGDEWRGDVARQIMYMYVRWSTQCEANAVGQNLHTYHADMPDIFLLWNTIDPVSYFEVARNNAIYSNQGNRNPFIDNPYIATMIWSGPNAEDTWGTLSTNSSIHETVSPILGQTGIINTNEFQWIKVYTILGVEIVPDNIQLSGVYIAVYSINDITFTKKIAK